MVRNPDAETDEICIWFSTTLEDFKGVWLQIPNPQVGDLARNPVLDPGGMVCMGFLQGWIEAGVGIGCAIGGFYGI